MVIAATNAKGKRHGLCKKYWDHEGKELHYKGIYRDGVAHGFFKAYWPDGRKIREGIYRWGWPIGFWKLPDENIEIYYIK